MLDSIPLTDMSEDEAVRTLAELLRPGLTAVLDKPNICTWAEQNYYLAPGSSTESHARVAVPIRLLDHQKAILNFMFHHPTQRWTTMLFSTVKKSGKTALGGLVARYLAETSGHYAEVYTVANDEEQSRGRDYKAALDSIENTPGYDEHRHILHGKWRIIERDAQYIPTKSFIRALSNDYRGEAGANPTATIWSETWGLIGEKSKRLWAELTPVPTRPSIRFVETYAGFIGESELLEELWDRCAKEGRRITNEELYLATGYDWPTPDPRSFAGQAGLVDPAPPIWVNEAAGTMGYIHQGEIARRMTWQTTEYYQQQAHELASDPISYRRFHMNEWGSSISELVPFQWYKACRVATSLPPLVRNQPLVIGLDAAVTSDYMACVTVSREGERQVGIRDVKVWKPEEHGGSLDYEQTIVPYLNEMAAKYNIVEVAFDPYQMHKVATDMASSYTHNMQDFGQMGQRLSADKQLVDLIRDRNLMYDQTWTELEEGLQHAGKKQSPQEDTKFRIIKKGKGKIDAVVALSMACDRCLYLNLL